MPIDRLAVENFKGIADRQEFDLRPITIFCGPNSSGKSSCIHALAAMAQTAKLSASQVPVVLDDEFAQVHLGRFLDVVHSRSIKDSFTIGLGLKRASFTLFRTKDDAEHPLPLYFEASFKAKAAAQEIYINSATMSLGPSHYQFEKIPKENGLHARLNGNSLPFTVLAQGRLALRPQVVFEGDREPTKEEMDAFMIGESVSGSLNAELRKTLYLGPFRQGPLRRYATRGSQPTEVGAAGESAVPMLANEFSRSRTKHPNLSRISDWLNRMNLGRKIQISPVAKTDLFDVSLTLADGAKLSIPDLGYGISQVLPVLVQCSFAPKGSTLLFEQPELHLHEGAARQLASVFVDVVQARQLHIVAETHSPHLFMELLRQVKLGRIKPEHIVLYDVARREGKSVFRKVEIQVDEEGNCEVDHPWARGLE
jgi:hypothetical protein